MGVLLLKLPLCEYILKNVILINIVLSVESNLIFMSWQIMDFDKKIKINI